MDALHVLHMAQRHQEKFPELQRFWHELTLGTSVWTYLTTVTLVLHPFQILFVPEALKVLPKVTKLQIIRKCLPAFLLHSVMLQPNFLSASVTLSYSIQSCIVHCLDACYTSPQTPELPVYPVSNSLTQQSSSTATVW